MDSKLVSFYRSQVGRKIVTGVTGIALMLFIIIHLIANLLLFLPTGDAYNQYTQALANMGLLLYVAEIGLLIVLIFHAIVGTSIYLQKRKARPDQYAVHRSAGDPSRLSLSSRSMILTGLVLLVFLVLHLVTFKYGPQYTVMVDGQEMRDLYTLVYEVFKSPVYVIAYLIVMILLGFHLRHGFWSALQSLGFINPRNNVGMYTLGTVFAVLMALGFLVIPVWIYFQ